MSVDYLVGLPILCVNPEEFLLVVIVQSLWSTMEHKSNVVMLCMNPHYCIELTHLAYHNSINLTKKVNKARGPLKEGPDGYTNCSLKIIPTKYPLVC